MENNSDKRVKPKKLDPSFFYQLGDKIVFTEEYHKRRGYCCGSGCKHCPFEPKHIRGSTLIKK